VLHSHNSLHIFYLLHEISDFFTPKINKHRDEQRITNNIINSINLEKKHHLNTYKYYHPIMKNTVFGTLKYKILSTANNTSHNHAVN